MPETKPHNSTFSNGSTTDETISMDESLLKKLRQVVEDNMKNEQFSVEDLAEEAAYSRSHLHRKLQKLTGESISQFIRNIRLEHSLEHLKNNTGTVSEIAFKVGFGSSTYFIKCFGDRYGFPPGEVKEKLNSGWSEKNTTDEKKLALEALHPGSDESMILEVFQALLPYKPSLEKFLQVDEDEGERVDIRLLAYQIIKSYPWPIGVELRRLFTASMLEPGRLRCHQLQLTITQILKLIVFILNCELVKKTENDSILIGDPVFCEAFKNLNPKNIHSLIIKQSNLLAESDESCFVEEVQDIVDESFERELSDWLELSEKMNQKETGEYSDWSASFEQSTIFFLKRSAFLAKYKLVNLKSILVRKARFKDASFEHQLSLLNSTDAEFNLHHETFAQFADSSAVLLMKSIKDITSFLNLSPFVIDTHGEETDSNQVVKRDLFLFDHVDGDKLQYHGSETVSKEDLSTLAHYQDLVDEYFEILKLLEK